MKTGDQSNAEQIDATMDDIVQFLSGDMNWRQVWFRSNKRGISDSTLNNMVRWAQERDKAGIKPYKDSPEHKADLEDK